MAFLDIRPLTPGHLLVVPRAHAASLEILNEETGTRRVPGRPAACRGAADAGTVGGREPVPGTAPRPAQEVVHVHLHVIPRTPGDGFRLEARPRTPERAGLDATAARVRTGMSPQPDDGAPTPFPPPLLPLPSPSSPSPLPPPIGTGHLAAK